MISEYRYCMDVFESWSSILHEVVSAHHSILLLSREAVVFILAVIIFKLASSSPLSLFLTNKLVL